jgi:hypothetical protein
MYHGQMAAISNRADWIGTLELINDDTGDLITDLTGVDFLLELRDRACRSPRLKATFDNSKAIDAGNGVIQWQFTASEMSGICAGTYELGITITRDGVTEQELIATQPVLDGVVRS